MPLPYRPCSACPLLQLFHRPSSSTDLWTYHLCLSHHASDHAAPLSAVPAPLQLGLFCIFPYTYRFPHLARLLRLCWHTTPLQNLCHTRQHHALYCPFPAQLEGRLISLLLLAQNVSDPNSSFGFTSIPFSVHFFSHLSSQLPLICFHTWMAGNPCRLNDFYEHSTLWTNELESKHWPNLQMDDSGQYRRNASHRRGEVKKICALGLLQIQLGSLLSLFPDCRIIVALWRGSRKLLQSQMLRRHRLKEETQFEGGGNVSRFPMGKVEKVMEVPVLIPMVEKELLKVVGKGISRSGKVETKKWPKSAQKIFRCSKLLCSISYSGLRYIYGLFKQQITKEGQLELLKIGSSCDKSHFYFFTVRMPLSKGDAIWCFSMGYYGNWMQM
ncbi:unnamed protein product [Linum tenue]|uniref:Uncharacterized protein n=1 Tax=Linum tenue TaxID=586396 RepID=A0AAV0NJQ3_9ROSI|nr:unnamed protein product [Linum tenue]